MVPGAFPIAVKEASLKISSNSVSTGNFNSAVATGNLIVVWLWYNSSTQSVVSVGDSKSNLYVKAVGPTTGKSGMAGWRQELWYAKNVTGGSSFSVTGTFAGTFNAEKAISAHEYSGLEPAPPHRIFPRLMKPIGLMSTLF